MTSKALIDSVLAQSDDNTSTSWGQRLFAHWYNRLILTQMWEDPRVEIEALALKPDDRVVCVASAGCNSLSILSQPLARLHAVEINSAHLAMLDLKLQAIRHLPDYQAMIKFATQKNQKDHLKRYLRHIRPNLQPRSRLFWESREFSLTPRFHALQHHLHHSGVTNRILRMVKSYFFSKSLNLSEFKKLTDQASREAWYSVNIRPLFDSAWFKIINHLPFLLEILGIPPSQWKKLSSESFSVWFEPKVKQLFCALPYASNPYLCQIFGSEEDFESTECLPDYLNPQAYTEVKKQASKLQLHHTSLTQFLENSPAHSIDAFVLSDVMDWLDHNQQRQLWRQILRCATPGARVVCRSVTEVTKLSELIATLPSTEQQIWLSRIHTNRERNDELSLKDRCGLLNQVTLWTISP